MEGRLEAQGQGERLLLRAATFRSSHNCGQLICQTVDSSSAPAAQHPSPASQHAPPAPPCAGTRLLQQCRAQLAPKRQHPRGATLVCSGQPALPCSACAAVRICRRRAYIFPGSRRCPSSPVLCPAAALVRPGSDSCTGLACAQVTVRLAGEEKSTVAVKGRKESYRLVGAALPSSSLPVHQRCSAGAGQAMPLAGHSGSSLPA